MSETRLATMAVEDFTHLLEPYIHLKHGRQQNAVGMSLGLGIAHSIVQAHGGQLRLENHRDGSLIAIILLPKQAD